MKITFRDDPEGRSDTVALNYARGNKPGGEKSTIWCSADLRTASKEANNPVADVGWIVSCCCNVHVCRTDRRTDGQPDVGNKSAI